MTIASIATPPTKMLSIQSVPSWSLAARLRRAVVAVATRTNRSSLPVINPGEPTSPPPTEVSSPKPLSDNQDSPMSAEAVRDLMAKNPKLPVANYFANNEKYLDNVMELEEILETATTFTSSIKSLATSMDYLEKAENLIVLVYPNQLKMQQKEQSNGDILAVKLKGIAWWQDTYHTFFTSSTTVSGLVAFASAYVIEGMLAVVYGGCAAAVAIVFLWVGKQVDSHKNELKNPVKKCKGISNAITGANKLEQGYLEELMALIGDLKSDNQSIQAMMGPEAAPAPLTAEIDGKVAALKLGFQTAPAPLTAEIDGKVAALKLGFQTAPAPLTAEIDGKVAALKLGFQRLLAKVDWCIKDAKSVREGVIHAAVKNLG